MVEPVTKRTWGGLQYAGTIALCCLAAVIGGWMTVLFLVGAVTNFPDEPGWGLLGLIVAALPALAALITFRRGQARGVPAHGLARRTAFVFLVVPLFLFVVVFLAAAATGGAWF